MITVQSKNIPVVHGEEIHGVEVAPRTRCAHHHTDLDIIAIKFKCCGRFFPCFDCHRELADHPAEVWPLNEIDEKAVLCGACGRRLSIDEYLHCDSVCPGCESQFNPGCANHYHLYFETAYQETS